MKTSYEMLIGINDTTYKASGEYSEYLDAHRENVMKAWAWMRARLQGLDKETITIVDDVIRTHDASKDGLEEYAPYANYFNVDKEKYVDQFNYAWLHHIHHNPHHWQYWVLVTDEEGTKALEIPKPYVLEMISDWWSFSWKTGKLSEIFDWYNKHKGKMILHPNTKKMVERILDEIKDLLQEENAN